MAIKPVSGEIKAQVINDNLSYVESIALQSNGGPIDEVTTVSELNSKYPSGANGIVLVDSVIYLWDGTVWFTKGTVYQSRGISDKSISFIKQNFIKEKDDDNIELSSEIKKNATDYYVKKWVDFTTGIINNDSFDRSFALEIPSGVGVIRIKTNGVHNRFTVSLANDLAFGTQAEVIYKGLAGDGTSTGDESYSFYITEKKYKYLVVGISTHGTKVDAEVIFEKDIELPTRKYLTEKVPDFIYNNESVALDAIFFNGDATNFYVNKWMNTETGIISDQSTSRMIAIEIPTNATTIKINTNGAHDRFSIGLSDSLNQGAVAKIIYKGSSGNGVSNGNEDYTFENEGYSFLVINISTSGTKVPVYVHIKRRVNLASTNYFEDGFELETGITTKKEVYPVLWSVKMDNGRSDDIPRPIGWLYYSPVAPHEIYYAHGNPSNLKKLTTWDASVTWNGIKGPDWYKATITRDGDIICVYRGDREGNGLGLPNVRQNPIIYPAGEWNYPRKIEIPGIKPTGWLQNCGVDFITNKNVLIFTEYTRPSHESCNIWKVTAPFDNPSNWQIKKTFALSGDNNYGMKHLHTANYDPFSGFVYASTGDDDDAAKILESQDMGETWNVVYEGQRKYARVLNFVFLKDAVYWANDDGLHGFYKVNRGGNNRPDFANIIELADLTGHPPTYANIYNELLNGVLILNRYDGPNQNKDIPVLFYSIDDNQMHTIATVKNAIGIDQEYGFRLEAYTIYPSRGTSNTVIGFGSSPINGIDLLKNSASSDYKNNINNYLLDVVKQNGSYVLKSSVTLL